MIHVLISTLPHISNAIFQRQCIMYGFNNLGKGELTCMLEHWMIMFKLSNNQHYIFISTRVVDQVKGLIRVSCSYIR
jgi:hypothetical protein